MCDRRMKNAQWEPANEQGNVPTWERVNLAVLLDIRDELQALNALLQCPKFMGIPRDLQQIRRNTTKRKRVTK